MMCRFDDSKNSVRFPEALANCKAEGLEYDNTINTASVFHLILSEPVLGFFTSLWQGVCSYLFEDKTISLIQRLIISLH